MSQKSTGNEEFITNPEHGGKVCCHKCGGFITRLSNHVPYLDHQHKNDFPRCWFHEECFNPYEHYYGIDRPLD